MVCLGIATDEQLPLDSDGKVPDCYDKDKVRTLKEGQIFTWDEVHFECIYDSTRADAWSFLRDKDGKISFDTDDGEYDPVQGRRTFKYKTESRLCMGVGTRIEKDGTKSGIVSAPYDYSQARLHGIKAYNKKCREEFRRVQKSGSASMWTEGARTAAEGVYAADPVTALPGVADKKAGILREHGAHTVGDVAAISPAVAAAIAQGHRGLSLEWLSGLAVTAAAAHAGEYRSTFIDHRLAPNPYRSKYGGPAAKTPVAATTTTTAAQKAAAEVKRNTHSHGLDGTKILWEAALDAQMKLKHHHCVTHMVTHIMLETQRCMDGSQHEHDW